MVAANGGVVANIVNKTTVIKAGNAVRMIGEVMAANLRLRPRAMSLGVTSYFETNSLIRSD